MFLTIPTALTWTRIAAIPLLMAVFYLPLAEQTQNLVAALMFIIFAMTDWFDGYLARKLNQTSAFGAFLDPVADKLMVAAALILLVQMDRVDAILATIIIGREITISALREWMAQIGQHKSTAVSMIGKVKTMAQMLAIPLLLYYEPYGGLDIRLAGTWLIYIAAVLTLWSMFYYMRMAWPHLTSKDENR